MQDLLNPVQVKKKFQKCLLGSAYSLDTPLFMHLGISFSP